MMATRAVGNSVEAHFKKYGKVNDYTGLRHVTFRNYMKALEDLKSPAIKKWIKQC
jgi:hypothetical protein